MVNSLQVIFVLSDWPNTITNLWYGSVLVSQSWESWLFWLKKLTGIPRLTVSVGICYVLLLIISILISSIPRITIKNPSSSAEIGEVFVISGLIKSANLLSLISVWILMSTITLICLAIIQMISILWSFWLPNQPSLIHNLCFENLSSLLLR